MNGIAISLPCEYPGLEVQIASRELGQIIHSTYKKNNELYWGYSNEIVLNRSIVNLSGELKFDIKYRLKGSAWSTKSIVVNLCEIGDCLIVGVLPNGEICLWDCDNQKSILVRRYKPIKEALYSDSWFRRYHYRFIVDSERILDSNIKLKLDRFDGTHEKLDINFNGYYLFEALPRRFSLETFLYNNKICLYFWMDYDLLLEAISKIIWSHPETKVDFIIRIDAENKKYELSLYRQGLKEPVPIPESAYQLIVFKNKFEDYRSENYNQPRGAWIW